MIITATELAEYMGRSSFPEADTALLNDRILPSMQSLIEQFCQDTFEVSVDSIRRLHAIENVGYGDGSYTMPRDANWQEHSEILRTLWLDKHLCQITTITNGDGVVVTAGQYTTIPRNETPWYGIRLKASSGVAWTYEDDPEDAIAINGRWGYSITPPAVIKMAALRWAKHLYRQRDTDKAGEENPKMSNDGVWIFPTTIPKDIVEYLKPLRRLV